MPVIIDSLGVYMYVYVYINIPIHISHNRVYGGIKTPHISEATPPILGKMPLLRIPEPSPPLSFLIFKAKFSSDLVTLHFIL